jgi:hypothetical protein
LQLRLQLGDRAGDLGRAAVLDHAPTIGHPRDRTDKAMGRSLTAEQRPTGPGVRLVRLCLEPLDPLVTDDAIVWAIRRAQARSW